MFDLAALSSKLVNKDSFYQFELEASDLVDGLIFLKEHHAFSFFIDYFLERKEGSYLLKIILKNFIDQKTVEVRSQILQKEKIPSLSGLWQAVVAFEAHYREKFNIEFSDHFYVWENKKFNFHEVETEFDLTNQFPMMEFKDKEELVTGVSLTKNHNIVRNNSFNTLKALKEASLYNPKDPISCEIAYSMAIEENLKIKIPEKAMAIRMIFLELQRISLHFDYIIQSHISLKEYRELDFLIQLRRKILDLITFYCHDERDPKFNTIGGCLFDLPAGWIPMASETLRFTSDELNKIYNQKLQSSLWAEKFPLKKNSGRDLLEQSVSGPNLRASGVNFDLRKNEPYYFYSEVDFEVPIGIFGTSYDRFIIRFEEIKQSIKIILQVLDNLPYGKLLASDDNVYMCLKEKLADREIQKKYKKLITEGHDLNQGSSVTLLETSRGLFGFYLNVEQTKKQMHFLGAQNAGYFSLEKLLCGINRDNLSHEIQSYGLHPWEVNFL